MAQLDAVATDSFATYANIVQWLLRLTTACLRCMGTAGNISTQKLPIVHIQGGPKSKPLPNCQQDALNYV